MIFAVKLGDPLADMIRLLMDYDKVTVQLNRGGDDTVITE